MHHVLHFDVIDEGRIVLRVWEKRTVRWMSEKRKKQTVLDVLEVDIRGELGEEVLVSLVHREDFANKLQIDFFLVAYVGLVVQRVCKRTHRGEHRLHVRRLGKKAYVTLGLLLQFALRVVHEHVVDAPTHNSDIRGFHILLTHKSAFYRTIKHITYCN